MSELYSNYWTLMFANHLEQNLCRKFLYYFLLSCLYLFIGCMILKIRECLVHLLPQLLIFGAKELTGQVWSCCVWKALLVRQDLGWHLGTWHMNHSLKDKGDLLCLDCWCKPCDLCWASASFWEFKSGSCKVQGNWETRPQ